MEVTVRGRAAVAVWLAVTALALAACAVPSPSPPPSTTSSPSGLGFEGMPQGEPVRIEEVAISADHRTVLLTFTSGAAYSPHNPCSTDVVGWAQPAGDNLLVAAIEVIGMGPTAGTDCEIIGYVRSVRVMLDEPFMGAFANDVGFGSLLPILR